MFPSQRNGKCLRPWICQLSWSDHYTLYIHTEMHTVAISMYYHYVSIKSKNTLRKNLYRQSSGEDNWNIKWSYKLQAMFTLFISLSCSLSTQLQEHCLFTIPLRSQTWETVLRPLPSPFPWRKVLLIFHFTPQRTSLATLSKADTIL
jgi:hypothetical protein